VQYNSAGALAADTGNFTYASGVLKAPTISATVHNGQYASFTTIFNPGSLSGNSIAANSTSSTLVSASNISGTLIQVGTSSATCASSISGSIRYGAASNTLQICTGTGWVSLSSGTASSVTVGGVSGSLQFNNGASSLGGRSDLLIDSSGRMGVGNASPIAKLDVVGTISASDAIQVSGSSLTCSAAIKGAIRYSKSSYSSRWPPTFPFVSRACQLERFYLGLMERVRDEHDSAF
jgi:hypothetical protein